MKRFKTTITATRTRAFYLKWLKKEFSMFSLAGLLEDDQPITLEKVYVPVRLSPKPLDDGVHEDTLTQAGKEIEVYLKNHRKIMITGLPGSGKTTLIRYLVIQVANYHSGPLTQISADFVPVPITLRECGDLTNINSFDDLLTGLWERAKKQIRKDWGEDFDPKNLQPYFDAGLGLFLLDGIDEIGHLDKRWDISLWILDHPFFKKGAKNPNWLLITGRPSGFEGLELVKPHIAIQLHVLPFIREQIRQFIKKWFDLRSAWLGNKDQSAQDLMDGIQSNPELNRLARRPAFLTLMAFIYGTTGNIPDTPIDLYEAMTKAYLNLLDQQRNLKEPHRQWTYEEKLGLLSELAYKSQVGSTIGGQEHDRLLQWTKKEMASAITSSIQNDPWLYSNLKPDQTDQIIRYFLSRTGLLTEVEDQKIQFGHLSFQEYLCAVYLYRVAEASGDKWAYLKTHLIDKLDQDGWDNVMAMLLAIDAKHTMGKGHWLVIGNLDLEKPSHRKCLYLIATHDNLRKIDPENRLLLSIALLLAIYCEELPNLNPLLLTSNNFRTKGETALIRVLKVLKNGSMPDLSQWIDEESWPGQWDTSIGKKLIEKTKKVLDQIDGSQFKSPKNPSQYMAILIYLVCERIGWTEPTQFDLDTTDLFTVDDHEINPKQLFTELDVLVDCNGNMVQMLSTKIPLGFFLMDGGRFCLTVACMLNSGACHIGKSMHKKGPATIPPDVYTPFIKWFQKCRLIEFALACQFIKDLLTGKKDNQSYFPKILHGRQELNPDNANAIIDPEVIKWINIRHYALTLLKNFVEELPQNIEETYKYLYKSIDYLWPGFHKKYSVKSFSQRKDDNLERFRAWLYVIVALADIRWLNMETIKLTKENITNLKEALNNSKQVAEAFPDPEIKQRQWEWVLNQPWSPVKAATELIHRMDQSETFSLEWVKEKIATVISTRS